jgi:hypothetical protein
MDDIDDNLATILIMDSQYLDDMLGNHPNKRLTIEDNLATILIMDS